MSFNLKSVMGAVFEDEETPAPKAAQTQQVPSQIVFSQAATTEVADHQDDAYQRLAAKTNWETSPAFVAIQKHLAPMDGLAVDQKTKFSIAVKQAAAIDGIDPTAINQNFEAMKLVLEKEAANFAALVTSKTATDVEAKKQQAEQLQAQVQQLTEAAFAAQQSLQSAQHKFDVAKQTRLTEINQKQAEYASLLG